MDINMSHVVAVLIALAGWLIGHIFTSARELKNKRREIRTQYLLEAYRRLESSSNLTNPEKAWKNIESAIADIKLTRKR